MKKTIHIAKTKDGKELEMYQELDGHKKLVITFDGKKIGHKYHYANYAGAWSVYLKTGQENDISWSQIAAGKVAT